MVMLLAWDHRLRTTRIREHLITILEISKLSCS